MKFVSFAWTACLAAGMLLAPPAAVAQELDEACTALGSGPVGSWARQRVVGPAGAIDVRFALVSTRGATWYEITAATPQGTSVMQLEVPGFPFRPEEIQSVVTKTGNTPAMVIPQEVLRQFQASAATGPLADLEAECRKGEAAGRQDVTVEAGSFDAVHVRFAASGGDVWVSDAVPFGIVRGEIPGQGSVELLSFGTGATGSIVETPLTLPESGSE